MLCLAQAREYRTLLKEDARTRPTMFFLSSLSSVSYEMLSSVSFFHMFKVNWTNEYYFLSFITLLMGILLLTQRKALELYSVNWTAKPQITGLSTWKHLGATESQFLKVYAHGKKVRVLKALQTRAGSEGMLQQKIFIFRVSEMSFPTLLFPRNIFIKKWGNCSS